MAESQPEFFATIPVSNPVVVPAAEDVQMNGFVWSHEFGLMVAFGDPGQFIVDELSSLREPINSIDRYSQQGE